MVNQVLTGMRQPALMRRLAACLILSLALAAPASAQQGPIASGPPGPDQAALKGSQTSTPPPQDDTPLLLPLPVQPTSISASASGGAQCRLNCSREYYFCLAGEDDRCPQYWSRCVSGCGG